MTIVDVSFGAFAFFSVLRLIAYVPQIVKISQDTTGAKAISNATWLLFAVSHLATAIYAVLALDDLAIGAVFIANASCCLVIVGLVMRGRLTLARQRAVPRDELKVVPLGAHRVIVLGEEWDGGRLKHDGKGSHADAARSGSIVYED